jgi:hypothetical protein
MRLLEGSTVLPRILPGFRPYHPDGVLVSDLLYLEKWRGRLNHSQPSTRSKPKNRRDQLSTSIAHDCKNKEVVTGQGPPNRSRPRLIPKPCSSDFCPSPGHSYPTLSQAPDLHHASSVEEARHGERKPIHGFKNQGTKRGEGKESEGGSSMRARWKSHYEGGR